MKEEVTWTKEQEKRLRSAIREFRKYADTEAYRVDLHEREKRRTFFQALPQRLDRLSEADVEEIVGFLWSHRMWGNKAYVARKIIEENTLKCLSENLNLLYEKKEDPEAAYEQFVNNVRRWGPASVTEMLAYIYPDRCGIWNKQARMAFQTLGLTDRMDVRKYRLSQEEYRRFNRMLRAIADELRRAGLREEVDLLIVDFFLYQVATAKKSITPSPGPLSGFDHDEIRDLIAGIGTNLGFDTNIEVQIAGGAKVDVVWRARIANLGMVTYVFEVHRSGSVDSLILNLQKALNTPTVQKVIAVSDGEQLRRIERECAGLPEQFRRSLRFWDVADVIRAADALQQVMDVIGKLGLLEAEGVCL